MEVAEGGGWGEDVQEPDDLKRRWPVRAGQPLRPSAPVLCGPRPAQDHLPFPRTAPPEGGRFPAFWEEAVKGAGVGEGSPHLGRNWQHTAMESQAWIRDGGHVCAH